MDQPPIKETPSIQTTASDDMAFRLLELQQKLEAWDRLYNEEIVGLRKELSQLKADFVRQRQTLEKSKRQRKIRNAG
jgi:hypothetical protein